MKNSGLRFKIRKFLLGNQIFSALLSLKDLTNRLSCIDDIKNKIDHINNISDTINQLSFFHRYAGEVEKVFAVRFIDYIENISADEYIKFIKNLDSKSIECVNFVLQRLYRVVNNQKYFYTREEAAIFYDMARKFYENIIPIREGYIYDRYILPVNNFESGVFYHRLCIDEINSKDRFADKDIIDAGAYIGDSALVLSEYTNKKVYAFEPVKSSFDIMLKTIELNQKTNIIPVPKGLADSKRNQEIGIDGNASGALCTSDTKETVELITLDEFVMNSDIEVGLIKTDLEGFEFPFLLGAINTIKRFKPVLLISVYHTPEDFFKIKPWLESLDLGYTFKFHNPVDGHAFVSTVLIAE